MGTETETPLWVLVLFCFVVCAGAMAIVVGMVSAW